MLVRIAFNLSNPFPTKKEDYLLVVLFFAYE